MVPDAIICIFWMLNFKPAFSLSSFTFIKRLFSSSSLSAIKVVSSAYLRLLIFLLVVLIPACLLVFLPHLSCKLLGEITLDVGLYSGTSLVQSLSHVWLFETPWTAARQASLSITNSWSLLKLTSIESVMVSNHLILCRPLLLPPSIFPSIRLFSEESVLHNRWPEYWNLSFGISPPNEYSGLISFRMDWLNLLAVQGTLKGLLQHHNSKASVLQCSAFFIVQLLHSYMTAGKTIALTKRTFVGKVMSLLFNMLSRFVIAFLPRSKHLLISWLQSPFAVILEPPKNKVSCCFHFSHLFAMKTHLLE